MLRGANLGFHSSMKDCQICVTGVGDLTMMIKIVNFGFKARALLKLKTSNLDHTYGQHHILLLERMLFLSLVIMKTGSREAPSHQVQQ